MSTIQEYHGHAAFAPGIVVEPHTFTPRPFDDDYDVEIKITHCGICASDIHAITGGRGQCTYPLVPGHEIVGHIVRIGNQVDPVKFAIGTRVGVGAQCSSCLSCHQCHRHREQLCNQRVNTYNSKTKDGYITQGGYADYYRCHANFVIPIPSELPSEIAAPMLCAGVTTYVPLKDHGAGPGKKVGVVGIGGLGHMGIQWAVALGAEVTAISSSSRKEELCKQELGAHHYLDMSNAEVMKAAAQQFDILLVTANGLDTNWGTFFDLVATEGKFILVAAPDTPISFYFYSIIPRQINLVGSIIGSPAQIEEMFAFAIEKNVRSIVQVMPMAQATEALHKVHDGQARFRIVLEA
ncbi:alcohol dehydrogenase GroESlike domain containing protein [Thraustotheca clavata]|uniref:Alcohol dehydrogenase GroESlike domain containing protein n=1 Tax=Thraustotheca clavata TaxID=74557 RepID=A0A1V9Z1G7_9STRA|nr:alcohol dehydrogenase GroESlike domain containing protein [Thraustotheca clavata]